MHAHPDSIDGATATGPASFHYECDRSRLPAALSSCFVALHHDGRARDFVQTVGGRPHGRLRTALYHGLRRVMNDFDVHGLLGMYRVHLLSTEQFRLLLQIRAQPLATWLDIGAGNGSAIAPARVLSRSLHATEASRVMRRRLSAQGVTVHDVDLCLGPITTLPTGEGFDVVSCLNVLDRCLYPRTMLEHARDALRPGGQLLIALALPLRPHVDAGSHSVAQEQPLPVVDDDQGGQDGQDGQDWEACATRLWEGLLLPAGLEVVRLSRAPYISQGDAGRPLHVLDDALFVCRAVV